MIREDDVERLLETFLFSFEDRQCLEEVVTLTLITLSYVLALLSES